MLKENLNSLKTKNNKVKIIELGVKSFLSCWKYQDELFNSIISVKKSNRKTKKIH
jgi:hypothetical protein